MYQAAICEDDKDTLDYIEKSLAKSFSAQGVTMAFDTFYKGSVLIKMIEEHYHYDVIFMDIEMPGENGIELCREIRNIYPELLIIFISNKADMVFESLEVTPFRFVLKHQFDASLNSISQAIVSELLKRSPHYLKIVEPRSKDIFSFDVNQILYVEDQGKSCLVVTQSGTHTIPCKLMYVEEKLSDYHFIKPHRSYLVNVRYIFCIQKEHIELTNHGIIPLSRNRILQVKQQFLRYTSEDYM